MRQFGMIQAIPHPIPEYHEKLHNIDRRGRHNHNWAAYHQNYVAQWENKHERIVTSPLVSESDNVDMQYKSWYNNITRLLISPAHLGMTQGFQPPDTDTLYVLAYIYTMLILFFFVSLNYEFF